MQFKSALVAQFLFLHLCSSIKVSEICINCDMPTIKTSIDMIEYKANRGKCEKKKCAGKYRYECGLEHCSIDKTSCHDFIAISVLSKIYKNQNFLRIASKIQNCSKENEWASSNFCSRSSFCTFNYPKNIRPLMSHLAFREASCRCKNSYKFECDSTYCADDKKACDKLSKHKPKVKQCI